jgi:hypothetical protein
MTDRQTAEMLDIAGLATRTSNAFRWALIVGADKHGFNPSYLAAVMRLESNFDPNVQNHQGAPALGLIQFWKTFFPQVARSAGRPSAQWEDLRTMSAIDQLPFVFAAFRGKGLTPSSSPTDYYMANFLPAFVGRPDDFVLGEQGSSELLSGTSLSKGKIYEQNAGLDANRDGVITVGDVGTKINQVVAAAEARPPLEVVQEGPPLERAPADSSPSQPSAPLPSPFSPARSARLPNLAVGSRGEGVELWQLICNNTGATKLAPLKVDGIFGPLTRERTLELVKSTRVTVDDWRRWLLTPIKAAVSGESERPAPPESGEQAASEQEPEEDGERESKPPETPRLNPKPQTDGEPPTLLEDS